MEYIFANLCFVWINGADLNICKPYHSPIQTWILQCDLIWLFLKELGNKFSYKIAQVVIGNFIGYHESITFQLKTTLATC